MNSWTVSNEINDPEKSPQSHLPGYHSEVHQHVLDAEGFMQKPGLLSLCN